MAVTQSLKDLQVIKGGRNDHSPDHSQSSRDYAPDHSSEFPNASANQPDRLWSVGELAQRYECSDRTVQKMYGFVSEAYPTVQLKARQSKRSMYTARCVELLDSLHQAKQQGIDSPQWVQSQPQENCSQSPQTEQDSPLASSPGQLAVSIPVEIVPGNELSTLVSAEWKKRETFHQQGIQRIEDQVTGRVATRDRLTEFVDSVYGDRVEEIKTKSALKDKLEQVVAADQVIENLDDDLENLIRQVVPVKNG